MRPTPLAFAFCLLTTGLAAADEGRPFRWEGHDGTTRRLQRGGDPAQALDLVLVTDGYGDGWFERRRLAQDVAEFMTLFETVEPFRTYRGAFNVWHVALPLPEGSESLLDVEIPHPEPRNLVTFDRARLERLLDAAGLEAWDAVHVLVDRNRFGGSAYAGEAVSITTRNKGALNRELSLGLVRVVAHELGHALAGLVEERPGTRTGCERLEAARGGDLINAFALAPGESWEDAAPRLPWAAWLGGASTITPTNQRADYPFAGSFDPDDVPVGAFEGAASLPEGGLRAQAHCLMRSDAGRFCVVCREALVRAFHRLSALSALVREPRGDSVLLTVESLLPPEQVALRWEPEDPAAEGDAQLRALLAEATQAQASRVLVPRDQAARVRCVVRDTTAWVRGVELTATLRTELPESAGIAGALPGS